jgi:hypothetical protein
MAKKYQDESRDEEIAISEPLGDNFLLYSQEEKDYLQHFLCKNSRVEFQEEFSSKIIGRDEPW